LAALRGAEAVFRRGTVACSDAELAEALSIAGAAAEGGTATDAAGCVARAARLQSGATHGLAALVDMQTDADGREESGNIRLAIATGDGLAARSSTMAGGRDWVRLGAIEMALDCLRRLLLGLPVEEKIDFEKVAV
jgi:nicotinamide-nucleotide amidase